MTLASAIRGGETVRLSYARPATGPLRSALGREVASFAGRTVTNDNPVPAAGALEDEADGCLAAGCPDAATGTAVSGPGEGQITVSWSPAATGGAASTWDVKYATEGGGDLTSGLAAGTRSHTFTGLDPAKVYDIVVQGVGAGSLYGDAAVARNIRPKDTAAPTVASATVNGTALTVTFGEDLDTGSVPAGSAFTATATVSGASRTLNGTGTASVSGRTVTMTLSGAAVHGETVTLAYAAPSSGALRDARGNAVADFSGQAVTNQAPSGAVDLTS